MNDPRCRACAELKECTDKMISLFVNDLSEMFTNCTSLEIAVDDHLPSHVCFECCDLLRNFSKFRQKCFKTDTLLREEVAYLRLPHTMSLKKVIPWPRCPSDVATESIKVEPIESYHEIIHETIIKYEPEQQRDIKLEFSETEYIDDVFLHPIAHDPVSSIEQSNMHPFDRTKYVCDYCGLQFVKKNQIASHMTKHKNEMLGKTFRTANFPCTVEGCKKAFASRKSFNTHRIKAHKIKRIPRAKDTLVQEKQLKLRCQECEKWFYVQHKLDAHVRAKHKGLRPYMCPHCDKGFSRILLYQHHLESQHKAFENKKFHCSYEGCDRNYGLIDSLKAHISRFHLGQIPVRQNKELICDQCGLKFSDGFKLKEHSYSHGELPFACKKCTKKFSNHYKLKLHTMRHNKERPFVCTICGARKTTNNELKAHLNFHTKEKSYPCKECPRVFASYGAHGRHVRIHHRNHKPYVCPHCQRAFTKAETMRNHIMTHTGEKPFACSECGHRFIQSVALKNHMKVHAKKKS